MSYQVLVNVRYSLRDGHAKLANDSSPCWRFSFMSQETGSGAGPKGEEEGRVGAGLRDDGEDEGGGGDDDDLVPLVHRHHLLLQQAYSLHRNQEIPGYLMVKCGHRSLYLQFQCP